jgi:hypothetical protein
MPLINASDQYFYLDADGGVVEGGADAPAEARSLLVAPGGSIDEAEAKAYGLEGRLSSLADVTMFHAVTGEEILHRGGRAIAPHLAAPLPRSQVVPRAAVRLGGKDEGGQVVGRQSGAMAVRADHREPARPVTAPPRAEVPRSEAKAISTAPENKGVGGTTRAESAGDQAGPGDRGGRK